MNRIEALIPRREAARLLGVSQTTLWRMVRRRQLGAILVGERRLLFEPGELRSFIKRSRGRMPSHKSSGGQVTPQAI